MTRMIISIKRRNTVKIKLPRYYSNLSAKKDENSELFLKGIYEKLFEVTLTELSEEEWFYLIEADGWTRGHPDEFDARLGYVDPNGNFRFHIIDQGKFSRINFVKCFSIIMHHEGIGTSAEWHRRADADEIDPQTQFCILNKHSGEIIFLDDNEYVSLKNDKDILDEQQKRCEQYLDTNYPNWKNDPLIGW